MRAASASGDCKAWAALMTEKGYQEITAPIEDKSPEGIEEVCKAVGADEFKDVPGTEINRKVLHRARQRPPGRPWWSPPPGDKAKGASFEAPSRPPTGGFALFSVNPLTTIHVNTLSGNGQLTERRRK